MKWLFLRASKNKTKKKATVKLKFEKHNFEKPKNISSFQSTKILIKVASSKKCYSKFC